MLPPLSEPGTQRGKPGPAPAEMPLSLCELSFDEDNRAHDPTPGLLNRGIREFDSRQHHHYKRFAGVVQFVRRRSQDRRGAAVEAGGGPGGPNRRKKTSGISLDVCRHDCTRPGP